MEVLDKRANKSIPFKSGVFHINSHEKEGDSKHVTFTNTMLNGKKAIVIQSHLLEKDNFRVVHSGARISLIVAEKKSVEKPIYVHNVKIKHLDYSSYERLKSFDYSLPSDYYVHIDTKWNEQKERVEVYFK